MIDNNVRSFKTERGEFIARVFPEKFEQEADEKKKTYKNERKFNIRIKQDDIFLLDALAKQHGKTRSTLINEILHQIMRDELLSIKDKDACVLLADTADKLAIYNDLDKPWIYDALGEEFLFMLNNARDGHDIKTGYPFEMGAPSGYQVTEEDFRSPAYIGIRNKLKDIAQ